MMARHTDRDDTREHDHRGRSLKRVFLTYLPPWVGWGLLAPVSVALRLVWGDQGSSTTLVALGLLIATALTVAFTRKMTHARGEAVRQLAMATTGAGGLWLIFSLIYAPWSHPWRDLYLLGGFLVCTLWTIYRVTMSIKSGELPAGAAGKLLEAIDGARIHGVEVERTEVGDVIHAKATVDRGRQTAKDLRAKATHIEAIAGLRPGSVMITGNPKDAGETKWLVIPTDTLTVPVLWKGPDRPGESVALPIRLGIYLDAKPMRITLPGDEEIHRNLAHILMNGRTGAGKSETARQLMAKVLCRTEVAVIASDPVKGFQTLGVFAETEALELHSLDEPGSREMLKAVKRSIPARGSYLGKRGLKQWTSGCGLTFLVVWLEEATWAMQSQLLIDLGAQARSVGIQLVLSQQRSSYNSADTDLRSNMAGGISGGLASAMDAKFNFPDDLVDMIGDTLESWGADHPGHMIANHPSIEPGDRVKPWQSELATDEDLRRALLEWRHVRSPIDDVTRAAFGDTYDKLRAVMAGADPAEVWKVRQGPRAVASDSDSDSDSAERFDDVDPADDGADDEEEEDVDDDAVADVPIDPKKPIKRTLGALAGGRPLGGPAPAVKLNGEQAQAVVQEHLRTLLAGGVTKVRPADIARMEPATTMSGEWLRLELHRLWREPRPGEISLIKDEDPPKPGTFDIIEPAFADSAA